MAKRTDFEAIANQEEQEKKVEKNNFDIEEFQDISVTEAISKLEEKDVLKEFLEKSKFMKFFENVSFDKNQQKINIPLNRESNSMLDTLTTILSEHYGYSKTEILNLIIASFFNKNKKELSQAYELFLKKQTNIFG